LIGDADLDLRESERSLAKDRGLPVIDSARSLTRDTGLDVTESERSLTGEEGLDFTGSGFGLCWFCSSKNLDILLISSFLGEDGCEAFSVLSSAGFGDC